VVADQLGVTLIRRALREQVLKSHLPLDPTPMVCYATAGSRVEREETRERWLPERNRANTYVQRARCTDCRFEPRSDYEQDEEYYKPIDIGTPSI